MRRMTILCLSLVLSAVAFTTRADEVTTGIDEQAQLPYWELHTPGMSLRLVQRLPMQTRGYFLARGFSNEQVERVAQSCVFQTVFRNTSNNTPTPDSLKYNLTDWVVIHNGVQRAMKRREHWAQEWQGLNIAKPQQLAFEWSLLPTFQEYRPGDYNWGMTSFNIKPGSHFDLRVIWTQFGKTRMYEMRGIECAPDINPQPAG